MIATCIVALVFVLAPVSAGLQIAFTVYDTADPDGPGNFNSTVIKDSDNDGIITLPNGFEPIGGFVVDGSKHKSIHGDPDFLISGSSSVTNFRDTPIRVYAAVSDMDYDPPVDFADVTGSGTFTNAKDSTIYLGWYNDPENGQGADYAFEDYDDFTANMALLTPGDLIDDFSFAAPDALESFNYNNEQISVTDPEKFSMTLLFDFTLQPGARYESALTSRGQGMSKYVPEFPTMALPAAMLIGFVGAVLVIRRTKES